ncbi:MAG: hypothetical protein ACLQDV_15580 [Candidatus Binataceae bacterium]
MLFVGLLRSERVRDYEFWAVLWQGAKPPKDFKLIAAYNLMTDLRVIVFEAESTESIRHLDRLNFIGHFECHPALDQTDGYRMVFARDTEGLGDFLRHHGLSEDVVKSEVAFRADSIKQPSIHAAIQFGRTYAERMSRGR